MKYNYILKGTVAAVLGCASLHAAHAQDYMQRGDAVQVKCTNASLTREGNLIMASMNLDLSEIEVKSNRAAVFTPIIVNGADTLKMPSVAVYGRTRWYQFDRLKLKPISGDGEKSMMYKDMPSNFNYSESAAYRNWMNGAELILTRTDYGCCGSPEDKSDAAPLAAYSTSVYEPNFRFLAAVAEEVKTRELAGRAYIDFPVNMTNIYPDYRQNPRELAKIIATIDSVRNDKDITVKRITIKGWASPESPWDNNTRLAKGRTETLKQYVNSLYHFPDDFIETDYYPEDWIGLREFVAGSNLEHKYEILAIIDDTTLEPDPKEWKLKNTYPSEYKFLLDTVYPGLRHSDYTIEYTIRGYTDIAEIADVMRTQPSKLSLNEMYLLAETYMPGSEAYNEIMETAARMYPKDETALVNAANAAMQRGDYMTAERYLLKAGTSADVLYARGVLAGLQKDYEQAVWYMSQAEAKGNEFAADEIEQLKGVQKTANR